MYVHLFYYFSVYWSDTSPRSSKFQRRRNDALKKATIEEKNMLLMGRIFCPLIADPMRIENIFTKSIKLISR